MIKYSISKMDITPPWPIMMPGYKKRTSRSTGIHDRLHARALLLDDGHENILIIALEVLFVWRTFSEKVTDKINRKHDLKKSSILLHTVHTHSGPYTRGSSLLDRIPGEAEEKYLEYLEGKILALVEECFSRTETGETFVGMGETVIGMNRRMKTGDGYIIGPNYEGPVDRDLAVIAIKDGSGNIKAVLVNCACHATIMTAKNLLISADFPGAACREIEKRYPGCTAMFIQAASGDINPAIRAAGGQNREGLFDDVDLTGRILANDVGHIIKYGLQKFEPGFESCLEDIKLPLDEYKTGVFEAMTLSDDKERRDYGRTMLEKIRAGFFDGTQAFLAGIIQLSPMVRIIPLEGEICHVIGMNIKKLFNTGEWGFQ